MALTGDLQGAAMNVNNGQFTTVFKANVIKDLRLDQAKNPKFLMVTGLRRTARTATQCSAGSLRSIYVVEVNSGILGCYGVPWNCRPSQAYAGQAMTAVHLGHLQLRNVAVRPQ